MTEGVLYPTSICRLDRLSLDRANCGVNCTRDALDAFG